MLEVSMVALSCVPTVVDAIGSILGMATTDGTMAAISMAMVAFTFVNEPIVLREVSDQTPWKDAANLVLEP